MNGHDIVKRIIGVYITIVAVAWRGQGQRGGDCKM